MVACGFSLGPGSQAEVFQELVCFVGVIVPNQVFVLAHKLFVDLLVAEN